MRRFDKAELGRLAREHGFARDTFEKVVRLTDILRIVNNDGFLQNHLVLKGGTAINLAILNLPRLSVDIDFDYTPNDPKDVRTSFDIIQSCNSNRYNNVRLTVEATELVAKVNGKSYSTQGVSIIRDGINYGSSMSFTQTTYGPVAAGAVAASFEVLWNTDSSLVQASYEACVTLTATAL